MQTAPGSQSTAARATRASDFKPRVRQLARGRYLVESATTRGVGHQVTATRCTCKGFAYRGACRHITLVQAIEPRMQAWYRQSAPMRRVSSTGTRGIAALQECYA